MFVLQSFSQSALLHVQGLISKKANELPSSLFEVKYIMFIMLMSILTTKEFKPKHDRLSVVSKILLSVLR